MTLLKYTHRIQNRGGIYEVKFLETDIFQGQFRSLLPFIPLHCMLPRSGTSVRFQHYDVHMFFFSLSLIKISDDLVRDMHKPQVMVEIHTFLVYLCFE